MRGFVAIAMLSLLSACELSVYSTGGIGAVAPSPPPPSPAPIEGWTVQGSGARVYVAEPDGSIERDGHPTIRFHPTDDPAGAYATLMTTLDAAPLRGRRALAVIWVRTQGVTGRGDAWIRVRGHESPAEGDGLAASKVRLAENASFSRYELLVDVPDNADDVQLGVGLGGPGMLWMDSVTVEAL